MHCPRRERCFGLILVLTVAIIPATHLAAETLPLIRDEVSAEQPVAWWTVPGAAAAGSLDELLFSWAAERGAGQCDPRNNPAEGQMSRVLRRADLTLNNARSIGTVLGCQRVLVGVIEPADPALSVPWLGLQRVAVRLRARLVDVERGSVLYQLDRRVVGSGRSHEEALDRAVSLLRSELMRSLGSLEVDAARFDDLLDGPVVVVLSGGDARGHVALMGLLADGTGGVVSAEERWASEGRVGVRITFGPDGSPERLALALEALEGQAISGGLIERVRRDEELILVTTGSTSAGESRF